MFVPKRGDICWLDFEPQKGKEIGKYRPALILSHEQYNRLTGLVICCPISTSGNDSNLLIVFYVQIMPDDFVMQL
uniref:type II toxin-antitoxin system PemK/MazF family toxin n=2 Tax=Escherichia coli TaxID=562 RepID=UPI002016E96C